MRVRHVWIGLEGLSVRGVAAEAGTTTRAVYSLFGSRDGLIVALGAHAYDLFRDRASIAFLIGIQRTLPSPELWPQFRAAATDALGVLSWRLVHLQESELLGGAPCATRYFSFTRSVRASRPSSCAGRSPPGTRNASGARRSWR